MTEARRKLPWRQLLSDPPSGWQRLPVVVRGIGDEILRALDCDGEMDCGDEHHEDVVLRICAAHPRERKMVRSAVRQLIDAGFLEVQEIGDRTLLRGTQPDLSVAARKAKRDAPSTHGPPKVSFTSAPTPPAPSTHRTSHGDPKYSPKPPESLNTGPVDKRREEEKREDKIIEQSAQEPSDHENIVNEQALFDGYQLRWKAKRPDSEPDGSPRDAQCSVWAPLWAEMRVKVRRQAVLAKTTPERVAEVVLDAFFADEQAATWGFPPRLLISRFSKYAAELTTSAPGRIAPPGKDFSDYSKSEIL